GAMSRRLTGFRSGRLSTASWKSASVLLVFSLTTTARYLPSGEITGLVSVGCLTKFDTGNSAATAAVQDRVPAINSQQARRGKRIIDPFLENPRQKYASRAQATPRAACRNPRGCDSVTGWPRRIPP